MITEADLAARFDGLNDTASEAEAIAIGRDGDAGWQDLCQMLSADSADLRFWAVRGLWANASLEAVELLIETLKDDDEMVRSGAALALGEMKVEEAVEPLAYLVTTDHSVSGNHAADSLAKIGRPAAPLLIEAMKHKNAHVRRRAAKALVLVASKTAIPVLFEALDDDSYIVRYYAEIALAKMGVGQMVYFRV